VRLAFRVARRRQERIVAKPADEPKSRNRPDPDVRADKARRFAQAIARAELGRFYWSERSEKALREAKARKPKR
jgi:hypothetical protein